MGNVVLTDLNLCFCFQVFVNFAKDQSDDYVTKDASVRRKDTIIEVPELSSAHGAAEGGASQRESIM